jgi:hypothetical protein
MNVHQEKKKALKSAYTATLRAFGSGAEGRTRTGMGSTQRFLSPSTLPEASGMQRTLQESSDPPNPCIMRFCGT